MVEVKYCGLTRPDDARQATALGARYVGVIFAPSPRRVSEQAARDVLSSAGSDVARVGVFEVANPRDVAAVAERVGLDIIQLHGDPDASAVRRLREVWSGEIWAVQRLDGANIPADAQELFACADAVVIDARSPNALGGTGLALPWREIAVAMKPIRVTGGRLVLAGGLRPENVARAIGELRPGVVDVSSGVESSPGIKDPDRMRAFIEAVRAA